MAKVRDARDREVSEGKLLLNLDAFLHWLLRDHPEMWTGAQGMEIRTIIRQVKNVLEQTHDGLHTNPGLVMYGNPPIRAVGLGDKVNISIQLKGLIGTNVHQLKYEHVDDRKAYVHDFEEQGTQLWAARYKGSAVLFLLSVDGFPLWQDFK